MCDNLDDTFERVTAMYEQTGSLRQTARKLNMSVATVTKMLVTVGAYESNRTRIIAQMLADGMDADQIAAALCCTVKAINRFVPYTKGTYKTAQKTINAQRIAACRRKMKNEE